MFCSMFLSMCDAVSFTFFATPICINIHFYCNQFYYTDTLFRLWQLREVNDKPAHVLSIGLEIPFK